MEELCCVTGLISRRVGEKKKKSSNLRASVGGSEMWVSEKRSELRSGCGGFDLWDTLNDPLCFAL